MSEVPRRRRAARLLSCSLVLAGAHASASTAHADAMLDRYFAAMEKSRQLAVETGTSVELRELVAQGEQLYLDGRHADALVLLVEAVESPRFKDFGELPEAMAAEHMLAATHAKLGAQRTAIRYLERALSRGARSPYFAPSVRLYADAALELSDADAGAAALEPHVRAQAPELASEAAYLRARARFDAGELDAARPFFRQVHTRSRFYGSSQYMLGLIASKKRELREAEARFCRVASAGTGSRYSFFVDGRFFEVQDLARLGLGRVAHESLRRDDAFYYYFQVPQDSPRLPDALFESAYSSYEGEEPDTAIDLLDQLQVRFPEASLSDEAAILRGYVALARCDFDKANAQFQRFVSHYDDVHADATRLLGSSGRRAALHDQLIAARAGHKPGEPVRRELVALLQVDPELYRTYDELARLDAESARSGRVSEDLAVIDARFAGSDRPRAAQATDDVGRELLQLDKELKAARASARGLGEQLDALRAAGVPERELQPIEKIAVAEDERIDALGKRVRGLRKAIEAASKKPDESKASTLPELLALDVARTSRLPGQVEEMRARLRDRADHLARASLDQLAARLSRWLSQARIGRVDAVMGSKRRIEKQIESLAAGRMPRDLQDPMRTHGLLADDEEYWPFEGEDWPDEHEERYPQKDAP
jgi:hypothetical protein